MTHTSVAPKRLAVRLRCRPYAGCSRSCCAAAAACGLAGEAALDLSTLERIEVQPQQLQLHSAPRPGDRAGDRLLSQRAGRRSYSRRASSRRPIPTIAEFQEGTVSSHRQRQLRIRGAGWRSKSVACRSLSTASISRPRFRFARRRWRRSRARVATPARAMGRPAARAASSLSLQAYDHAMDELSLTRSGKRPPHQ